MESIHLGLRENSSSVHSFSPKKMWIFYYIRDEIHLSVNESSFGTREHYLKVISISRTQQGKIGKGWSNLEFVSLLWCHEIWLQVSDSWMGFRSGSFLYCWWDGSLFDERRFQRDSVVKRFVERCEEKKLKFLWTFKGWLVERISNLELLYCKESSWASWKNLRGIYWFFVSRNWFKFHWLDRGWI